MNKTEKRIVEKAKAAQRAEMRIAARLLEDRIKSEEEVLLSDGRGYALSVVWNEGGTRLFYSIKEVEDFLEERNRTDGRGGARPGAGRKPNSEKGLEAKESLTVRLSPAVRAFLMATGNASDAVDQIVRRTKAFRES